MEEKWEGTLKALFIYNQTSEYSYWITDDKTDDNV